jgi:hypothetical protein
MAMATGSHLCNFHGRLILIPIRKTQNSPSMIAVILWEMIGVVMVHPWFEFRRNQWLSFPDCESYFSLCAVSR